MTVFLPKNRSGNNLGVNINVCNDLRGSWKAMPEAIVDTTPALPRIANCGTTFAARQTCGGPLTLNVAELISIQRTNTISQRVYRFMIGRTDTRQTHASHVL